MINNNNNNDKNIDDQMVCLICTNPIAAEKTVGFCKNEKCRKTICGECIQKLRNPDQCPFCQQNSGFDLNWLKRKIKKPRWNRGLFLFT